MEPEPYSTTVIREKIFSFRWLVKDLSKIIANGIVEIQSSLFKDQQTNTEWFLLLHLKNWASENHCHIGVEMQKGNQIGARVRYALFDQNGSQLYERNVGKVIFNELRPSYQIFSQRIIESSTKNDQLIIQCTLSFGGIISNSGTIAETPQQDIDHSKHKNTLAFDLGQLLKSGWGSDFTITTKTGKCLVHKSILSCRSTVFAAMFQNEMKESVCNTVEIKDFEEDVIKGMLEYIYGGEVSNLKEDAMDLFQIAEKYNLTGLKEICEQEMKDNITTENAAEIGFFARLYNANSLKDKAIDYIHRNIDKVEKTDGFKKLTAGNNAALFLMDLYLSHKKT